MTPVTNRHNAPAPIVRYAKNPHYDSGDSDYTVTQLIDSPRISILRTQHADEIDDDPYENLFRLIGTAIHSAFERAYLGAEEKFTYLAEERIYIKCGDTKISGAIDLQTGDESIKGVVIGDYKFTAVYSLGFQDKWEKQLNLYALLHDVAKPREWPVKRLEVYALLRDWSFRTAKRDRRYPQTPGVTVEIKLWDRDVTETYFHERLAKHEASLFCYEQTGSPLPCTKEEMWEKDSKFAVLSESRITTAENKGTVARAVRLLDSMEEAEEYASDNPDYFVEERPGERTRCENFCEVSRFCNQWKEYNGK